MLDAAPAIAVRDLCKVYGVVVVRGTTQSVSESLRAFQVTGGALQLHPPQQILKPWIAAQRIQFRVAPQCQRDLMLVDRLA